MAADLVLAPEAHLDAAEAYACYEDPRLGLSEEFLSSLDASVESLGSGPDKPHRDGCRRHGAVATAKHQTRDNTGGDNHSPLI
jgi:hypothetical protein